MTWPMAIFTYVNLWWVSLFFAWPFSIEAGTPEEAASNQGYAAAPKRIFWKKLLVLASLLSTLFTAVIAVIIHWIK